MVGRSQMKCEGESRKKEQQLGRPAGREMTLLPLSFSSHALLLSSLVLHSLAFWLLLSLRCPCPRLISAAGKGRVRPLYTQMLMMLLWSGDNQQPCVIAKPNCCALMCGCVMAGTIWHSLMGKVHVVSASDGTLMTAQSTFSDCPVRLPDNNVTTVLSVHQETQL